MRFGVAPTPRSGDRGVICGRILDPLNEGRAALRQNLRVSDRGGQPATPFGRTGYSLRAGFLTLRQRRLRPATDRSTPGGVGIGPVPRREMPRTQPPLRD